VNAPERTLTDTSCRKFPCRRCGEDIGRNVSLCDPCVLPHRREERARLLKPARDTIDNDYRWARFGAPALEARVVAKAHVLDAARKLLSEGQTVITIVGGTGVGKTSLACAILAEEIEAGMNLHCAGDVLKRAIGARFFHAYDLSVARAEHRLGGGEPPKVVEAKRASVVVIDELGRDERKTSDVAEVIRRRLAASMPTIITTWQTQEEVKNSYDGGIARRLFQRATLIPLGGRT
jgi:DNA replication protein DnaC